MPYQKHRMQNEVGAALVEFIFNEACSEEEMDFASVILLRQVSRYLYDTLTTHRLSQKAMKQGGPSLLIMYTLLRPSHSHRTTSLLKELYQQQPSHVGIILLILNLEVHNHHPDKSFQMTPSQGQIIKPLSSDIHIYARQCLSYFLQDHTAATDCTANFCKYMHGGLCTDCTANAVYKYLNGRLSSKSMMEHMMDLIICRYPNNSPIVSGIITFLLRLKQRSGFGCCELAALFVRSINRCIAFDIKKEYLLVNILRGMCYPSSSNMMIQFRTVAPSHGVHPQDKLDELLVHAVSVGWFNMTRLLLQMGVSPDMCNMKGFSILMLLARQGQAELYALARGNLPSYPQYGETYHRERGKWCKNALHMAVNSNYTIHLHPVHLKNRQDTVRVIIDGGLLHPGNMAFTKGEQKILAKLQ